MHFQWKPPPSLCPLEHRRWAQPGLQPSSAIRRHHLSVHLLGSEMERSSLPGQLSGARLSAGSGLQTGAKPGPSLGKFKVSGADNELSNCSVTPWLWWW